MGGRSGVWALEVRTDDRPYICTICKRTLAGMYLYLHVSASKPSDVQVRITAGNHHRNATFSRCGCWRPVACI